MNDIQFEEQLKGLRHEAAAHLQGWEFTPAMRQRVLERIAAEPEQSESAPRRRHLHWGPWMAAMAVAASVATVAVFTGGRSLQVDKMGTSAQMSAPQAAAPAAELAPAHRLAPAGDRAAGSAAAQAPAAAPPAKMAAQLAPAPAPSPAGAGDAAVSDDLGQSEVAAALPTDASGGAGVQVQQALPPAGGSLPDAGPDGGGAQSQEGMAVAAEGPAESAPLPAEAAVAADPPAEMATMMAAGAPAAGEAGLAAGAERATAGEGALPVPPAAAASSDLWAEVLAADAGASVRVAAHLRPRDSTWLGPVEVRAWVMLPGGERLLLEPRMRRVPGDVPVGGEATVVFGWNGLDLNGRPLAAGTYHVQVEARAADGRSQLAGIDSQLQP